MPLLQEKLDKLEEHGLIKDVECYIIHKVLDPNAGDRGLFI